MTFRLGLKSSAGPASTRPNSWSANDERRLYDHYDLPTPTRDAGDDVVGERAGNVHENRERADAVAIPDAMTRSEDEVTTGVRSRERGRARLKKYVVTDHVQKTIPVRREEGSNSSRPSARKTIGESLEIVDLRGCSPPSVAGGDSLAGWKQTPARGISPSAESAAPPPS